MYIFMHIFPCTYIFIHIISWKSQIIMDTSWVYGKQIIHIQIYKYTIKEFMCNMHTIAHKSVNVSAGLASLSNVWCFALFCFVLCCSCQIVLSNGLLLCLKWLYPPLSPLQSHLLSPCCPSLLRRLVLLLFFLPLEPLGDKYNFASEWRVAQPFLLGSSFPPFFLIFLTAMHCFGVFCNMLTCVCSCFSLGHLECVLRSLQNINQFLRQQAFTQISLCTNPRLHLLNQHAPIPYQHMFGATHL